MVSRLSFLKSSCSISLSIWTKENMDVRGFPISWAIPAASLPMEASFSEWIICSSMFFISVTSCTSLIYPCISPSSPFTGAVVTWKYLSFCPNRLDSIAVSILSFAYDSEIAQSGQTSSQGFPMSSVPAMYFII